MICMSLDMICISKRAINFHPSISIKANGITSHYRGQPLWLRRINMWHRRKTKKLTLFDQIILRFKLENMSVFRTDWYFNGPCYLKSKLSPQKEIIEYMSFHLIESSVLKVTKVKLSSLMWKIRHFKGQFLVSVSPNAKAFPQFTQFFIEADLPLLACKQHKETA